MFRDMLLPLVLGDIHESAVRHACALAAANDGQVAALVAVSLASPAASAWAYYPAGAYESMDEAATAATGALSQAAEQRLSGETAAYRIHTSKSFWLTPGETSALHARYADLTVLGVNRPPQAAQRQLFADLLSTSGRPLLLVPEDSEPHGFGHVVIAWKSSREAARAVNDALPLLQRASTVDLLMVERGEGKDRHGDRLDPCLASHLDRHGVPARVVRRSCRSGAIGETIIEHARESRADLIVAGGYSRPRALERVFGGVTRHLLEHAPVPVLFSH